MNFTFKHGDRPLPEYELRRGVGRGGFGEVYYAVSDGGREVAIKYLHTNVDIELRGARHCMNLKSPHLVTIFDIVKSAEGDAFIIMEYIPGPSLRDLLIAEPGGLGIEKATFILRELAKGLTHLHASGVVHRDLKPGNIFYDEGYVKIGDYGLSKIMSQSTGGGNTASVGTVAYMAPEVGSGNYSRSIDIYALGVVLYEMLMGRVPFEGQSTGEVLMKHLVNQPEVDALPAPFAQVIRKSLAKDPRDRYQSVDDMARDVLGTAAIQDSLAGFDATCLSQVAARAIGAVSRGSSNLEETVAVNPQFSGSSVNPLPETPPLAARADAAVESASRAPLYFAGFWVRLLAYVIDCIVCLPLGWWPAYHLYAAILHSVWDGQTLGKKIMGIRVVNEDDSGLDFGTAFWREAGKLLNFLILFIGYLMIGITRQKRGLHDMIASTYVVYAADQETPTFEPQRGGVEWSAERGKAREGIVGVNRIDAAERRPEHTRQ